MTDNLSITCLKNHNNNTNILNISSGVNRFKCCASQVVIFSLYIQATCFCPPDGVLMNEKKLFLFAAALLLWRYGPHRTSQSLHHLLVNFSFFPESPFPKKKNSQPWLNNLEWWNYCCSFALQLEAEGSKNKSRFHFLPEGNSVFSLCQKFCVWGCRSRRNDKETHIKIIIQPVWIHKYLSFAVVFLLPFGGRVYQDFRWAIYAIDGDE